MTTLSSSLKGKLENSETPLTASESEEISALLKRIKPIKFENFDHKDSCLPPTALCNSLELSTKLLDIKEQVLLFTRVVMQIETERKDQIGTLTFDKDDELAMDFVIATSNIRAYNFGITMETAFKLKEMAGKIVPAISSSNALVASLQVIEAIKLLSKDYKSLRGL